MNASNLVQCPEQSVGPVSSILQVLLQTLLVGQCAISPPTECPEDRGPNLIRNGFDKYDFIVVGAGSAGWPKIEIGKFY